VTARRRRIPILTVVGGNNLLVPVTQWFGLRVGSFGRAHALVAPTCPPLETRRVSRPRRRPPRIRSQSPVVGRRRRRRQGSIAHRVPARRQNGKLHATDSGVAGTSYNDNPRQFSAIAIRTRSVTTRGDSALSLTASGPRLYGVLCEDPDVSGSGSATRTDGSTCGIDLHGARKSNCPVPAASVTQCIAETRVSRRFRTNRIRVDVSGTTFTDAIFITGRRDVLLQGARGPT